MNAKEAFHWITGELERQEIAYRITGGLAASVYGSPRELADIDIEIARESFDMILPKVASFILTPPHQYRDAEWDVFLMILSYKGQEIDICAWDDVRLFDATTRMWVDARFSSRSQPARVFDKTVPLIPKQEIITYKAIIRREVDLEDLRFLQDAAGRI